jgi:hypothetical protein
MPDLLNHGRQAKLEKSRKVYDIRVSGLHLTPGRWQGRTMCGDATPGCLRGCLNTCGRGGMNVVQRARQRKTSEFLADPWSFAANLMEELDSALVAARRRGVEQWFRLNLTSDVYWESYLLPQHLRHCYDYTKSIERWQRQPYHLTYSWHENQWRSPLSLAREAKSARRPGVAVVVDPRLHAQLTRWRTFRGVPVVDGTLDDQRPYDPSGALVLLRPLGRLKSDTTGFVIRDLDQLIHDRDPRAVRRMLPTL